MPEISNLYAEIGFKVNESGLQEFTERLVSLKKEIDEIAKSLKGIESLKINIPTNKVQLELQKLANQNTRTEIAVKREDRLERAFQYRKQQDAERKEEKREKEKQRETKRHEKFMGGIFRGLGATMLSVGGTIAALTKFGFSQAEKAAIRSNVYKNYEVLTGDKSFDLQELSSLAVATGGASGATALNELSGQLLNLKRNWSQLVRDEGNAKELKLLGLRGHQSPAEMARAILNVIENAEIDPGIIAESLTNLGLNASSFMRMAQATPEQKEMAKLLKGMMPSNTDLSNMQKWYVNMNTLDNAVVSTKDNFSSAFISVDPDKFKRWTEALADPELEAVIHNFGVALGIFVAALEDVARGMKDAFKGTFTTIGDLFSERAPDTDIKSKYIPDFFNNWTQEQVEQYRNRIIDVVSNMKGEQWDDYEKRKLMNYIWSRPTAIGQRMLDKIQFGGVTVNVNDAKDVGPALNSMANMAENNAVGNNNYSSTYATGLLTGPGGLE